jgi:signal transduction histidine kinase
VFFELYRQRQEVMRQRDELKAATEEITRLLTETRSYAEALKEADKRKDEFLAILAHELRNPLAPIRNAVEIIRTTVVPTPELVWARDIIDRPIGGRPAGCLASQQRQDRIAERTAASGIGHSERHRSQSTGD